MRDLREKLNSMKMSNGSTGQVDNQRHHSKPNHTGNGLGHQNHTGNGHGTTGNGYGNGDRDYREPKHNNLGRSRGGGGRIGARGDQGRLQRVFQQEKGYKSSDFEKACKSDLPLPTKNTVNFNPSHIPPQMRIIAAEPGLKK